MSPKLMVLEFMETKGEPSIGLASESSRSTGEADWAGEANAATLDRAVRVHLGGAHAPGAPARPSPQDRGTGYPPAEFVPFYRGWLIN